MKRRFEKSELYNPAQKDGIGHIYSVVSGINRSKKPFSRNTWIKIITSDKTGKGEDRHPREKFDKDGNALSCDLGQFHRLIYDAAYEDRKLFVGILLNVEGIRNDFLYRMLSAVSSRYSNKECKVDCDAKIILDAHKKYYKSDNVESVSALIEYARNYDYMDDWLLKELLKLTGQQNMKEQQIYVNSNRDEFEYCWQNYFSNTQSGAVAALSGILWNCNEEPEWFDAVYKRCFDGDNLQMAISGVELIYPLCNVDIKRGLDLFIALLNRYPKALELPQACEIINKSIHMRRDEYTRLFKEKWTEFSTKIQSWIQESKIAYFCLYKMFEKDIKKAIRGKRNSNENRDKFAITCVNIIEHNDDEGALNRTAKVIRWIIKYSPQGASDLLLFAKKNIKYYHSRRLLIPLINNCSDKFERNMRVHSLDDIIKEMPQLHEYEKAIFAVSRRLLKTERQSSYDALKVIQWLVTLYWEIKKQNSALRKKCLNAIDKLQMQFGKLIG